MGKSFVVVSTHLMNSSCETSLNSFVALPAFWTHLICLSPDELGLQDSVNDLVL